MIFNSESYISFLADAPVLTGEGYIRIDTVRVGDQVMNQKGIFKVTSIFYKTYSPGLDTCPYIIPDGRYGAIGNLRISPHHRILVNGRMVEACNLDLEQEVSYSPITYYNIGVEREENILVAGVEVESFKGLSKLSIH